MSLAKVSIIGNLGRDPETRYTPTGALNVQFSVAASRKWKDNTGQQQEKTTWFRVTAWGKLAETLNNLTERGYLGKGKQVYVEGRVELNEYTANDGTTRSSLDVNATEVQLLGSRGDTGNDRRDDARQQFQQQGEAMDDAVDLNSVPF